MKHRLTAIGLGILLVIAPARAAETNTPPPVVTHHAVKVGSGTLNYTATAGFLAVDDEAGKPQANLFYIAYTKDGREPGSQRPITFAFNGGPGASSMWLHLGALGPKRAVLADNGLALPETYQLVDNDQTWLEFTDLVFVDPIGTGYSRTVAGVDADQFYNVPKDVEVCSRFVRQYVTRYERWLSPKYVAGESYGTTRAAGLANQLQSGDGLNLAGVVLISSVLNFQYISYGDGNDMPFALALPTFAAAAKYHKKANADPAEVEQWALGPYLTALARGETPPAIVEQMAKYTGLTTNFLTTARLRVSTQQFTKELLRSDERLTGLMDSRVVGVDVTPRGEYPHYDPALFLSTGPFVATLYDYLRHDLNVETNIPYEFLSHKVNGSWKWSEHGQGYVYVADDLAEAMTRDKHFRVFAAAGLYDLTTPYFGQKTAFDHMGLDPSLQHNFTFKVYESGHQIYTDLGMMKKLRDDAATFYANPPAR
jgi:carboxypeptidase C (cathepsin A)